ncbi:ArsC family transcriptional regulator [Terasakiella brassicae]|uniref:ArsC family transcriptional regulator n=1 Tax=Terasakiella brassicae TaxID=1634917 RepID=A0A917FCD0_9PROT|nr:low molecular weight phosphatase family protein [Terasakiella brassicae]GGF65705.1 ArsC family transcriptional regulator [Terasakiella brassicae]
MSELPSAILFCCTMNAIRSPMAEGIMKLLHGRQIYVDSCGVRLGQELDGFVMEVMDEIGIDMSKHKPKTFDQLEDSFYDRIITLSPEAHHHALEMAAYMDCDVTFWNTFDPSLETGSREQRLEAYRAVRDQLMMQIKRAFPRHGMVDV